MGSGFSASGLISGLDSNDIVQQLMQLERRPIMRLENSIGKLEKEKEATNELLDSFRSLRTLAQDFRTNPAFSQFEAASSNEDAVRAEVSGDNPVTGTFAVDVHQLASPTVAKSSATMGASIDTNEPLNDSGIRESINAGQFTINGVEFEVDPDNDTLGDVMQMVNDSGAGVTMSYDADTDRVTIANDDGSTDLINLGGSQDTSNFLQAVNLTDEAPQENGAVTSTRTLGAVDRNVTLEDVNFDGGAMTAGSFSINGVSITVDPTEDTLQTVLDRINNSDARVTASYDEINDTIRVVSDQMGSSTINFSSNSSNFLELTNLADAEQAAGQSARFTVNGGEVLTRNSNTVSDAIGGVRLQLDSVGASTVTVEQDDDAIVERVRGFVDAYNENVAKVRELTSREGALANDSTVRMVENSLQRLFSDVVEGAGGSFSSLLEIGISTGRGFDSGAVPQLQLDEEQFLEAMQTDQANVRNLFTNQDRTGIADRTASYLDEVASSRGVLARRTAPSGSIAQRIRNLNDQIDRTEDRVARREKRLRAQFTHMEQMLAGFQNQGAAVGQLGAGFRMF